MNVIWRSDAEANPIGMEARLIEIDGERTLEATFSNTLSFSQKMRAIWNILVGRAFSVASIYLGEKEGM